MKTLKLLHCALTLALTAPAMAQAQSAFVPQTDSIHISGKVEGFKPGGEENFIKFTTYTLDRQSKKQAVQLKADGSFDVKLYQPFAGDISLNYANAFVDIFTQPGKHLVLRIINSKMQRAIAFKDAIVAEGDLAGVNNTLLRFQTEFDLHKFKHTANANDTLQSDSLFATRRLTQLNEEQEFLNQFAEQEGNSNPTFVTWQRNQFIYTAAAEMLTYPFMGKLNKTITHKQLMGFIKGISIDNSQAMGSSAWYHFIRSLVSGLEIIVNVNPSFAEQRHQIGYNSAALHLDKIDAVASGLARQLMYYAIYRPQYVITNYIPLSEKFNTVLKDPYLKALFDVKTRAAIDGFIRYSVTDKLQKLNVSADLKKRLLDLFEQHKGSYLYLDFWGDWCGPCMSEMPNYPKLLAAFDGKPLKFIFMSAYTTEQSMRDIQNKHHITAEFINLSKDEASVMNNVFDFHSYPSHFLIDKNGMVVNNSIGHISTSDGLQNASEKINQLLQLK